MISIVIPLYNKEHQIAKTLQSVFAQTYTDYEIVIVNDGSTDNSVAVVGEINDPRIRLISQQNKGVSAARNKGINEAKGDYIAFLDSDDNWEPDYLESIADLIKKYPEANIFGCRYKFSDEYGNERHTIVRFLEFEGRDGIINNYFKVASNSDAPLWTSAIVAKRSALIQIGGFPEGVVSGEDLLTWAKLACNFKIAFLNEVKATYYCATTGPTGKVPPDLKSVKDFVGCNLAKLSKAHKDKHIDQYVAFWYKMRSRINLNRNDRWAAFKCALKAVRYNPYLLKAWALLILSGCPRCVINKILDPFYN